jgi:hypothetical protein
VRVDADRDDATIDKDGATAMSPPTPTAELEIGLHRLDANRYSVELRSRPAGTDADMTPIRGTTTFDFRKLQDAEWDGAEAVGRTLGEQLFSDPDVLACYQQTCVAADTAEAVLRVHLFIDPTVPELHPLKWEMLHDPVSGKLLATRERVLFSRHLTSHDWRPIKLRPREQLRAVLAIANPMGLGEWKLSPINVERERKRAQKALGWYDLRLMSWGDGSGVPCSGSNLVIVGTDNNGLLHIRIFDAGSSKVTDTDETKLAATQVGAFSTLKQRLPDLLPPHVLTDAEKNLLISEATSIVGRTPPDAIPIVEVTGRATFSRLINRLREEFDILYLVAHGALVDGEPFLWLESDVGTTDKRPGRDLVDRLGELPRPPRLVVFASCQSGDTEAQADDAPLAAPGLTPAEADAPAVVAMRGHVYMATTAGVPALESGDAGARSDDGALVALGPRLAEAGIPAVVAMRGNVSMTTIERFMPVFFRELCRDGQIDRAMAVARFEVRDRPDVASPVLFLRLTSGRIWYVPGFARTQDQQFDLWPGLLVYLDRRKPKVAPILGSGLLEPYLGSAREFARGWARNYQFPLAPHAQENLPQVAQYLTTRFEAEAFRSMFEQELIKAVTGNLSRGFGSQSDEASAADLLAEAGARRRATHPADPHRVLADLPIPIYLTTNPDRLLVDALREAGKAPVIDVCPWTEESARPDSIFAREPKFSPSVERPLVYYLFGRLEDPKSLVLTEDDYFDYLIGLTRNNELIPEVVRMALTNSALFFLGFRLDDWDFRVLFRSLMAQAGSDARKRFRHIAVQIDPEESGNLDPAGARRFLQRYFELARVSIYWGHVDDFADELLTRRNGGGPRPTEGRP